METVTSSAVQTLNMDASATDNRILAYNSHTNDIVEQQHQTIQELIVEACKGNISKWPTVMPYTFWASCTTTCKSTGHSPFYMAQGVEPVIPYNITLTTFLVPNLTNPLLTAKLIGTWICQLQRCEDNLAVIHTYLFKSCFKYLHHFECQFENTIHDFNFQPGGGPDPHLELKC